MSNEASKDAAHVGGWGCSTIDAGDFSAWLDRFRLSLSGESGNAVDCGDCIGCCSSSYFIHIAPTDEAAIAEIPSDLCFPAPGLPDGNFLMGYDGKGSCPMMRDRKCAVYDSRPGTCRKYDCRVFSAAGIDAGGAETAVINDRIRRWRFSYRSEADRHRHEAIKAAASFLREHRKDFPGGRCPDNPSQVALIAIASHEVFLEPAIRSMKPGEIAVRIMAASRQGTSVPRSTLRDRLAPGM